MQSIIQFSFLQYYIPSQPKKSFVEVLEVQVCKKVQADLTIILINSKKQ